MPDYSEHIMKDWKWFDEYKVLRGKEEFDKYVNRIYELLLNMKPDSFFQLNGNVDPANIDLFIKICCMFIQEHHMSRVEKTSFYTFNADCTQIRHVSLHFDKSGKPINKK